MDDLLSLKVKPKSDSKAPVKTTLASTGGALISTVRIL